MVIIQWGESFDRERFRDYYSLAVNNLSRNKINQCYEMNQCYDYIFCLKLRERFDAKTDDTKEYSNKTVIKVKKNILLYFLFMNG